MTTLLAQCVMARRGASCSSTTSRRQRRRTSTLPRAPRTRTTPRPERRARHLVRHVGHVGHRAGHPQGALLPPGACAHFKHGQNKAAEQLFPIFPSGTTQRPRRLSMRRLNDERELELLVRMRYLSPKSQGPDKSGLLFSPATYPSIWRRLFGDSCIRQPPHLGLLSVIRAARHRSSYFSFCANRG